MRFDRGDSGGGDELLGADLVGTVDRSGSRHAAIVGNDVDGLPADGAVGPLGLPLHDELVAAEHTGPMLDGTDDPLHEERVSADVRVGDDDDRARVLQAGGVLAVDDVGPGEAAIGAGGKHVRQRREVQEHEEDGSAEHPEDTALKSGHGGDSMNGDLGPSRAEGPEEGLVIPRWMKAAGTGLVLVIAAAMAFAILQPIKVLPRLRLAPGYALVSADGELVNSEAARGTVTLYTFAPTTCGDECDRIDATMAEVRDRVAADVELEGTEFRLITIALDQAGPEDLAAAAAASGADGSVWQWLAGEEAAVRTIVGGGFRRFYETEADGSIRFDPGYVLVDGAGIVRGEYRYQTLADDADKIVDHIGVLADEIRYANGATAVAYEAAHLFLCYP